MRVIISAGGTGGHIYPALAIINKLKAKEPHSEFLYIGTHNRMEKDIIPNKGIPYQSLEVYGFTKNILKDIKNIFLLKKAQNKCIKIMREFKPDIVIGVGGYVTYPVIRAAHQLKIKTIIHEQNAIPGKSNKSLSKIVDKICVSFKESKECFPKDKVIVTGNPCSENAINLGAMDKTKLGLSLTKKLVVIVAGSLGSMTINNKMQEFLTLVKNKNYEVLYITGKNYYEEFNKNKFSNNVKILPYVENLSSLFKNTDIVVTRSGASTISELVALEIPSIYIPSPYVPNNHQYYNALKLQENNASLLIEEKKLDSNDLLNKIDELLENKELYLQMKNNLSKLAIKNSSELIYQVVKEVINE